MGARADALEDQGLKALNWAKQMLLRAARAGAAPEGVTP